MASVSVISTGRPRHGRRFLPIQELEIMHHVEVACMAVPGYSDNVIAVAEMTGPVGIPDITVVVPDVRRLHGRLASDIAPILGRTDTALIAALPRNAARSIEWSAHRLTWPEETVVRRSSSLVRQGALRRTATGLIVRPAELQAVGRTYAIEVKVKDWQRGLRQIDSYRLWADGAILVIGPIGSKAVKAATEHAKRRGVGLLVDGHWCARPRLRANSVHHRLWASEHVVRALRSTYQPSEAP